MQDDCGGGLLEPDGDDGPVGDEDPSFSLPPHPMATTAAMAMKNNPARFMLHSFAGSLDDLALRTSAVRRLTRRGKPSSTTAMAVPRPIPDASRDCGEENGRMPRRFRG
jgi:hypothetical protein